MQFDTAAGGRVVADSSDLAAEAAGFSYLRSAEQVCQILEMNVYQVVVSTGQPYNFHKWHHDVIGHTVSGDKLLQQLDFRIPSNPEQSARILHATQHG